MLKKTLVIALIGVMVGGVAMGVVSLADRSSTSGGRGQEQANEARVDQPRGQGRGQRSEVSKDGDGASGAASYGGRNFEAGHEDCDCEDCTSSDGRKGQDQLSGNRGARSRSASGSEANRCGTEQGRRQYTQEQAALRAAGTPPTGTRNSATGQGGRGGGGNPSQANFQAELVKQSTVDSTVVALGEHIIIETEDGTKLELGMGPSFYREEIGFATEMGDELTVTGFHEDGEFKVLSILDESGTLMLFRNEYGRPGWSGRGNRKNSIS